MRKVLLLLVFSVVWLFASMDLNSATKSQLMDIKGIGAKKADKIIEFRKINKIQNASDLKSIKGFGDVLIANIENGVMDK